MHNFYIYHYIQFSAKASILSTMCLYKAKLRSNRDHYILSLPMVYYGIQNQQFVVSVLNDISRNLRHRLDTPKAGTIDIKKVRV